MQAAVAAEEEEAQPSGRDFDDTASEASSAVSGMSAYGGSTATGASSVAGSSGRSASTVGGRKPYKRRQKKVSSLHVQCLTPKSCRAHPMPRRPKAMHGKACRYLPAQYRFSINACLCPGKTEASMHNRSVAAANEIATAHIFSTLLRTHPPVFWCASPGI